MRPRQIELAMAAALVGVGAPVHAGVCAGVQSWPRVLVKVGGADFKNDEPWRARHVVAVIVQGKLDAGNAQIGAAHSPAYADFSAILAAVWAVLETRGALTAAIGAVDARLENYRADIDGKQGLFVGQFEVFVEV